MSPVGVFYRWIAPPLVFLFCLGLLIIAIYRVSTREANGTLTTLIVVAIAGMLIAVAMFVIAQSVHQRALRRHLAEADSEE